MESAEKLISATVAKNRKYLDALEEADKSGKRPVLRKVRKNFTLDEIAFMEFRNKCAKAGRSMSNVIEELMKKF